MNELTTINNQLDIMSLGEVLKRSGYFSDVRDVSHAIVKILAGQELGIGPIAAMTGIYIVKGRVTLSANLMASQIKRSGRYDYRVTRIDDTGCEITFYQDNEPIGISSFTEADAKSAGLLGGENWKKFPRNMYFARALSNGAKWYCPDLFAGPVYTPDEMGSTVSYEASYVDTTTGEIIDQSPGDPDTPPATDKQRNFIAVLQEKLAWSSEQLIAYAEQYGIHNLYVLSKNDAGMLIEGMQQLLGETKTKQPARAAEKTQEAPNGKKRTPTRQEYVDKLKVLWAREKELGGATPAAELAIDLDNEQEATIERIIPLGKAAAARVKRLETKAELPV